MFILGYEEETPPESFLRLVEEGLGGVIFFTRNIKSREQFQNAVELIKSRKNPELPLFLSIDQEGGRVERTLNLHCGSKYLNARTAAEKGEEFVAEQTSQIAAELKDFGLNMNFAPVLDVDTNPKNPVIAERSYSSDPQIVSKIGEISAKTYLENGILPVGKHFPGHGETSVDSHVAMPELGLSLEELEKTHIAPFKSLINKGVLPVVMAAHIHYTAFDSQKTPASISKNVLTGYLRGDLGFDGLIISDDMVMGGITGFTPFEACKKGIEAGINMFIYRDASPETLCLIDKITAAVERDEIDINKVEESLKLIRQAFTWVC